MDLVEQKMLNNEQQKVGTGKRTYTAYVSFDEAGGGNYYELRHKRTQKNTAAGARRNILKNCNKTTENFQTDPKVHTLLREAFNK